MGATDEPHRPLLQILCGSTLERWIEPTKVAFALGSGGSYLSDACGLVCCWLVFYVAIVLFYATAAPLVNAYVSSKYPNGPTSKVSQPLVANMKDVAQSAFPLYVTVPMLTDYFQKSGWARTCDDIGDCGGWGWALLGCVGYFCFLEVIIFLDHYYLLHKWDVGKRLGQHAFHHVYKYADQLNAFSGYSFAPQDGWSQGMALALGTLVVRVPLAFVFTMEVLTGLWTLYIHTDVAPLPWPMMGCDYHYIHHRYNWYNFGFMTVTMDTLFRTVKHPKADALAKSHGAIEMPEDELRRSAALTAEILSKRGHEALRNDDAAGNEDVAAVGSSHATLVHRRPIAAPAAAAS